MPPGSVTQNWVHKPRDGRQYIEVASLFRLETIPKVAPVERTATDCPEMKVRIATICSDACLESKTLQVGVGCLVHPVLGTPTALFAIALLAVSEGARVPFLALMRGTLPVCLLIPAPPARFCRPPAPVTHPPTPSFGSWTR